MSLVRQTPLLFAALSCIGAAHADVTLRFVDQPDGVISTVMVKDGKVRIEDAETASEGGITIFDSASGTLTVIMDSERSYSEFTAEDMRRQAEQMKGMLQDAQAGMKGYMEEAMRAVPPEQRAMIEQQMAQMGMDMSASLSEEMPKLSTRRTGRTEKVAGVRCEIYESYLDADKIQEACVASPGALDISKADHQALVAMMDFMGSMAEITGDIMGADGAGIGADFAMEFKEGVPVQLRDLEEGSLMVLQDHSDSRLGAELFQVPAGYRRTDSF